MKMMLAMAVALANIASMDRNAVPKDGHALWSTNVTDNSGSHSKLEVRVFPDFSYRVVYPNTVAYAGIQPRTHEFLDGAIAEALQFQHGFGQERDVVPREAMATYFPTPTHLVMKMIEMECVA